MALMLVDGDVLLYFAIWGTDSLKEAKTKFRDILTSNLEDTFTKDYALAFGGPNNFRKILHPEYKMTNTRKKVTDNKPEWFEDLKHWAASMPSSHLCDGYEADDQLRVWAQEAESANTQYVISSVDKDLDCIPGMHFNPRTSKLYKVDTEYADWFYWKQILMGDGVDNIPGIKGMGPKKAEALLVNSTKDNRKGIVCKAYHQAYKEQGYENLVFNGRLIHLWRYMGDYFKVSKEYYNDAIS
jgi:DNA polymerase-1